MATAKFSDIVSRLGHRPPGSAAPDPDLLGRLLATRDEQAFALIVRRHGPMVFGVCRRVTGNYHLAEDDTPMIELAEKMPRWRGYPSAR